MSRPRSYPDDLRDRLIEAAVERLRDESPGRMSLRELAASVDTSTNAIYSIFGSKDALLEAVVEVVRPWFANAQLGAIQGREGLDALRNSMTEYRAWGVRNPWLYRLLIGGDSRAVRFAIDDEAFSGLFQTVRDLIADGVITDADPIAVTTHLWLAMHAQVLMEISGWPEGVSPELEQLFDFHLEATLRGIAGPQANLDV